MAAPHPDRSSLPLVLIRSHNACKGDYLAWLLFHSRDGVTRLQVSCSCHLQICFLQVWISFMALSFLEHWLCPHRRIWRLSHAVSTDFAFKGEASSVWMGFTATPVKRGFLPDVCLDAWGWPSADVLNCCASKQSRLIALHCMPTATVVHKSFCLM